MSVIKLDYYVLFSIDDCVFICILIMDVCTYNFWFISGFMLIIGLLYATLVIIMWNYYSVSRWWNCIALFSLLILLIVHLSIIDYPVNT